MTQAAQRWHYGLMARWWAKLDRMLEATGFDDVEVRGALSDRPPTADDDFVVFIAKK